MAARHPLSAAAEDPGGAPATGAASDDGGPEWIGGLPSVR